MARGLEAEWEKRRQEINAAQAELARREKERPRPLGTAERGGWRTATRAAPHPRSLLKKLFNKSIFTPVSKHFGFNFFGINVIEG